MVLPRLALHHAIRLDEPDSWEHCAGEGKGHEGPPAIETHQAGADAPRIAGFSPLGDVNGHQLQYLEAGIRLLGLLASFALVGLLLGHARLPGRRRRRGHVARPLGPEGRWHSGRTRRGLHHRLVLECDDGDLRGLRGHRAGEHAGALGLRPAHVCLGLSLGLRPWRDYGGSGQQQHAREALPGDVGRSEPHDGRPQLAQELAASVAVLLLPDQGLGACLGLQAARGAT
mmetsp:Transcript_88805/g.198548  ORF Transcript_88805/g.198548 Transcript_88805/m.198548 type:complete len:229 (+) Transcript_88805:512-1198(+)